MENIFSLDVFLISLPIYLACLIAGYMLAIKPKRDKKLRSVSFSTELYNNTQKLKIEKPEDYEIYLKLARLFRTNGEFDKAVEIHKRILQTEGIPTQIEVSTILELGQDYLASGLFDKAEESLLLGHKLAEKGSEIEIQLLNFLSELYERQVNWEQAVNYRRKLFQYDKSQADTLSLLLCNLAKQESEKNNLGNAKEFYEEAISLDAECILAVKETLAIHFVENKNEEAFKLLKEYSSSSQHLLNLLAFAFEQLINDKKYTTEMVALLDELVKKPGCDYEIGILYTNYLLNSKEDKKLNEVVELYNEIHKNNLQAIYHMALFLKESKFDYDSKDHSIVLLEKIENMLKLEYNYQCSECGYHTKHEFWHCPQCQKWDTVKRANR